MQGDHSLMASFVFSVDNQTMRDIEKIYKDSDKIFGSMTKAGADCLGFCTFIFPNAHEEIHRGH